MLHNKNQHISFKAETSFIIIIIHVWYLWYNNLVSHGISIRMIHSDMINLCTLDMQYLIVSCHGSTSIIFEDYDIAFILNCKTITLMAVCIHVRLKVRLLNWCMNIYTTYFAVLSPYFIVPTAVIFSVDTLPRLLLQTSYMVITKNRELTYVKITLYLASSMHV